MLTNIESPPLPTTNTERHVSALAQQCVNIKKDAFQFRTNDREFKQAAIQLGLRMTNEINLEKNVHISKR